MSSTATRTGLGAAVTPGFLVAVGLLGAVTALADVVISLQFVGGSPAGGFLEFLLLAVPAVGLTYAGYWLHVGDFEPVAVWRIGAFAVAGAALGGLATGALLADAGGPYQSQTVFVLFVAASTEGSLLGVLTGTFAAIARRSRRAGSTADRLETLHSLLRHDLRNRLTIVGGHLDFVAEAGAPADSVATIRTQLEAIDTMLTETAVAVSALRDQGPPEPSDLVAVVGRQVEYLERSYDGVTVTTDLPETAWVAAGELLGAVVDNLLQNAVAHHDGDAPSIAVRVAVEGDRVRLEVADDGPGIPASRRDAAFEPGVGDGTGLGLYLVDAIVDRYGGTVELRSNEPRGTVAVVALPRASPDQVA